MKRNQCFIVILIVSIIFSISYLWGEQKKHVSKPEVQELVKRLESTEDPVLRRGLCEELGRIRDKKATSALIQALNDEDFGVRMNACDALGNIGDERATPKLIELLKDKHSQVKISAISALGSIRDVESVAPLIKILEEGDDSRVRLAAIQVLGKLGDKRAVLVLTNTLTDSDVVIRKASAKSLGEIRAEEGFSSLIDALGDKDMNVRRNAAESLGNLGNKEAIKPLNKRLKKEQDLMSKVVISRALSLLGSKKGLKVALKGTESKDFRIRIVACETLGNIGINNEKVINVLKEALNDENDSVVLQAKMSLQKLGVKKLGVIKKLGVRPQHSTK